MNLKATLPAHNASAFNCPHCGIYSSQEWTILSAKPATVTMAECFACHKVTLWLHGEIIYPIAGLLPPPHVQMPAKVYTYFNKARNASLTLPEAAAAYLREAMRQLLIHLGGLGKNSGADIEHLMANNLGSHKFFEPFVPAKLLGTNIYEPLKIYLDDDETIVALLAYLLNALIEEAIASPATLAEFYSKLSDPKNEPKPPPIDPNFFERN